jgi:hypothetical protein
MDENGALAAAFDATNNAIRVSSTGTVTQSEDYWYGQMLSSGESVFPRMAINNSNNATSSGVLRLTFWTARKTETCTRVRTITGSTAAGATPTVCRMGIYTVDANGDGTLVASTANDTTLFATQNTAYTKSFSGGNLSKVKGQRYAFGIIVVTGAAAPSFAGCTSADVSPGGRLEFAMAPRLAGNVASLSDLPSSFTEASLNAAMSMYYGAVIP